MTLRLVRFVARALAAVMVAIASAMAPFRAPWLEPRNPAQVTGDFDSADAGRVARKADGL